MTKRPAKGNVKSLEELLDWGSGELRDSVTSFLDAEDVGRLAMTSKRCRSALEDESSGKLRVTNLELLFDFEEGHDDAGRLVAKPCDLSPIYDRIHIQRVERLHICICYEKIDGAEQRVAADEVGDDGRGRIIDVTPILAAVQSLLVISRGLTTLALWFDSLPDQLCRPGHVPRVFVSCEYAFSHFANCIATLPCLATLDISSSIGQLPINLAGRAASSSRPFPAMKCLRVRGALRLQDVVRNSLLFLAAAPASRLDEDTGEAGAPSGSDADEGHGSSSTVAESERLQSAETSGGRLVKPYRKYDDSGRPRRRLPSYKIQAFSCVFDSPSTDVGPGAGRDFWMNVVNPSTTVLELYTNLIDEERERAEDGDEHEDGEGYDEHDAHRNTLANPVLNAELDKIWNASGRWLWTGATGVRHLIVNHFPRADWLQLLPSLRSVEIANAWYRRKVMRRPEVVAFFGAFSLRRLTLHRVDFSASEVGWLAARFSDAVHFLPKLEPRCRQALQESADEALTQNIERVLEITALPDGRAALEWPTTPHVHVAL